MFTKNFIRNLILKLILVSIIFYFFSWITPDFYLPLSIFTITIIFWLLELIPISVTSILVPVLALVTKLLEPVSIVSTFLNSTIFLLLSIMVIGVAFQKHQCDKVLLAWLLKNSGTAQELQAIAKFLSFSVFCLSMWISNTATCAIFIPIYLGIIEHLNRLNLSSKTKSQITLHLLLGCSYSASVGGLATPLGSPPNLLVINLLAKNNIVIGFIDWVMIAFPLAFVVQWFGYYLLRVILPLPGGILINLEKGDQPSLKLNAFQKQSFIIFLIFLGLWILPEILPFNRIFSSFGITLNFEYLQYLTVLSLFFLPQKVNQSKKLNLSIRDLVDIPWSTLLLFAAGICLGEVIVEGGLVKLILSQIENWNMTPLYLFLIITLVGLIFSEFISNTATVSILSPLVLSLALLLEINPFHLLVALVAAGSFGFMLPTSTIPNALIFGTKKIKIKEMVRYGLAYDLFAWLIVSLYLFLMLQVN